ncbi:IclR family transcriptional regulator [Phenylobacterium sp.]|uniref:IclR family transcriptional regulator n=1 Tax=Phenylobacterium sp. TaxID=1871053 RepID=UPI0035B2476E
MDEDPTESGAKSPTGTVSRVLQLLTVLADADGELSVKRASDLLGLAPPTVHRLLQLLRKEGFAECVSDSRKYVVGPQFYRVAARVAHMSTPAELAQPVMQRLADEFNETVILGLYLPEQHAVTFVARADGNQRLRFEVDMYQALQMVWSASGKAILAYLPEATARAVWKGAPSIGWHGGPAKPTVGEFLAELELTRSRGYALSELTLHEGSRNIAAPVFGAKGVIAGLCLTVPVSRPLPGSTEEIGQTMSAGAAEISALIGGRKAGPGSPKG